MRSKLYLQFSGQHTPLYDTHLNTLSLSGEFINMCFDIFAPLAENFYTHSRGFSELYPGLCMRVENRVTSHFVAAPYACIPFYYFIALILCLTMALAMQFYNIVRLNYSSILNCNREFSLHISITRCINIFFVRTRIVTNNICYFRDCLQLILQLIV